MLRLVFCVVAMIVGSIVLGHGCGQSSSKPVELISGDSQAKDLEKELEARIAKKMSNPELLQQVVGLFLVQIPEIPDSHGCAFLIDRQGAVRHRFDCQVLSAQKYGEDGVFLTRKNVVRVTSEGKVVWTILFDERQWDEEGTMIDLPSGDSVVFHFHRIADSGVNVIRFDPSSGNEKWTTFCAGLGVMHSQYLHSAKITVEDDKIRVTSEGSSGTFVEILDLKTGRQLNRTRKIEVGWPQAD